jgi:type IV pilus assembly protein PilN
MIRINLLPYRAARKKENIRIQVNVFLGSVLIIGLLVFVFNSHLKGRVTKLNEEISSTQAQLAKYQQINKEIGEIKKKLALLTRKIEVIESLERDRKAPVENLDSLYQILIEKRMWYTQIDEKGDNIKISGIAVDNQTVADYMTRIEKSERFQNVRLASIKQNKMQGKDINLKQFDINFIKKKQEKEQKPTGVKAQ